MIFVFEWWELLIILVLIFAHGKAMQESGKQWAFGKKWEFDVLMGLLFLALVCAAFVLSSVDINPQLGELIHD